jgi:hypothetical protein
VPKTNKGIQKVFKGMTEEMLELRDAGILGLWNAGIEEFGIP